MKLELGQEYKRTELHKFFGGQTQGGISTPSNSKYVFIIAYKKSGKDFGYEDGWDMERNFYFYTGEGQVNDMQMIRGNKAIKDHKENDKKILLFQETKETYIKLEAELIFIDFEYIQTIDREGNNRRAIQFRLQSIDSKLTPKSKNKTKDHREIYIPPNETERKGLVTTRVGQGKYRRDLIQKFEGKCAVTKTNIIEILIASHIVPWRESNDKERTDKDNGILLSPLYDALFDKHLISFQEDGKILISKSITDKRLIALIDKDASIDVSEGTKKYLQRHRALFR